MSDVQLLYLSLVVVTVASPGPGVMMTLDNAIAHGWRPALAGIVGLALGAALMAGLSSLGVGVLIRSSPPLFAVLKYCGVGYLFYLAGRSWLRSSPGARTSAASPASADPLQMLATGVLLQTSNPKSLLFFLSVLPQIVERHDPSSSPATRLIAAIATYCVALLLIHALYAGLAASARRWLSRPAALRWLSRLSAVVYLGFGVLMLALE